MKKKRRNIVVVEFFSLLFQFYTSRSRVDVEALHNHRFSLFLFPSFLPLGWRTKRKKKKGTRHAELRGKCLKACIIDARFHRETDSSLRVSTKRRVGVCLHTSLSIRDRTVNQEEQCKKRVKTGVQSSRD